MRELKKKTYIVVYNARNVLLPPINVPGEKRPHDIFGEQTLNVFQTIENPSITLKVAKGTGAVTSSADSGTYEVALDVWDDDPSPTYPERIESLKEIIKNVVGNSDEWIDQESTLHEYLGLLVIKTNARNHTTIRALLEAMGEADASTEPVEVP